MRIVQQVRCLPIRAGFKALYDSSTQLAHPRLKQTSRPRFIGDLTIGRRILLTGRIGARLSFTLKDR